jgi:hypothetical protein
MDRALHVRVGNRSFAVIEQIARSEGQTISFVARALLLEALRARGMPGAPQQIRPIDLTPRDERTSSR